MPSPAKIFASQKHIPGKSKVKKIWKCEIINMRLRLGLSLRDIETATGIHNVVINYIELGADPKLSNARKLAAFFEVTIDELWPAKLGEELRGE